MRKTAEPRENKIGPRADCQNKNDVSRHSNARPDSAKMSIVGHGLARSLTSLTRFGTSFWALILAACGGGGQGARPQQLRQKTLGKTLGSKHPIYFRCRSQNGKKKLGKNGGGEGKVFLSDLIVN